LLRRFQNLFLLRRVIAGENYARTSLRTNWHQTAVPILRPSLLAFTESGGHSSSAMRDRFSFVLLRRVMGPESRAALSYALLCSAKLEMTKPGEYPPAP
jgi:hypothetical protein